MALQAETRALTKGERTRLAMLQAAVAILDEAGPDALTLQAIGDRVELHPTAAYRHFESREQILAETLGYLIDQLADGLDLPEDPRARIMVIAVAFRDMFHRHPGASTIFVTTAGAYRGSAQMQRVVLDALRELGVPKGELALAYQMIESYVVGASLFDFAAAPAHLSTRRERHRVVGDPDLDGLSSDALVDANNEEAFRRGLEILLPPSKKKSG